MLDLPDKRGLGILAIMHSATKPLGNDPSSHDDQANVSIKGDSIRRELKEAGMTAYGLLKFNTRYLPNLIHKDEHVRAVIYGRFREGSGLIGFADRMVVATNLRVISLNHKPGYTDTIEFTYDVIGSADASKAWLFTAVTLNTKVGNFTVRFTNNHCAEIFVNYVEKRRLEDDEEIMLEEGKLPED